MVKFFICCVGSATQGQDSMKNTLKPKELASLEWESSGGVNMKSKMPPDWISFLVSSLNNMNIPSPFITLEEKLQVIKPGTWLTW